MVVGKFKHRGITMSEEIETLISEIMDADECEILEFDFRPIFSKLRNLGLINKALRMELEKYAAERLMHKGE